MSHVSREWGMSQVNESCLKWMSHIIYKWVMSHVNEACRKWMSHVSYEWVTSHINESCLTWMRHVASEWGMSQVNESCLTKPVAGVNESCFTWKNHSQICWRTPMGWLRLVGSFKLQVSFATEPYKRDDILQKRLMIFRSLLIVAPYQTTCARPPVLYNVAACCSVLQRVAVLQ